MKIIKTIFFSLFFLFIFAQYSYAAKRWVSIDEVAAGIIDPHIGADYADQTIGNLYDTLMWVNQMILFHI